MFGFEKCGSTRFRNHGFGIKSASNPLEVMKASHSELARIEGLGSARAKKILLMMGSKNPGHKKTGQKKLS